MARNPCVDRLQKEYRKLLKVPFSLLQNSTALLTTDSAADRQAEQEPSPNIKAHPTPGNLLEVSRGCLAAASGVFQEPKHR